jgi:ADP-heptose:LPS heptosyltransferase
MMRKVLIISTNALGDTYLSAAAIEPIIKAFKEVEIHFISQRNAKPFLDLLSIDNWFFLESKKIFKIVRMILRIRKIKYDFVFTFFPGVANSIIFYLTRANNKAGFSNLIKKKQWHNSSQKATLVGHNNIFFVWEPNMNFLDRITGVLSLVQIKVGEISKPMFPLNDGIKTNSNNNFISIHFKSRVKNKSLSDHDLIELCGTLYSLTKYNIILIGSKSDFTFDLIEACKRENITLSINPEFSILLTNIIKSKLFIGVDSFPLHIADAHNINFIGLFGPTCPESVLVNHSKSVLFEYDEYLKLDIQRLMARLNYINKNE